tara:strand:+ start:251 stop:460 length:210 start_codon:yes stop_codon:yes gene_type:complete
MSYKEGITASFNKVLLKKLRREQRGAAKSETDQEASNAAFTKTRREAENRASDRALAEELGVNITELDK